MSKQKRFITIDAEALEKELRIIRALSAELIQRTSCLEEKLSPVQERASRKGLTAADRAVLKRNKRMLRG